MRNGSRLPIFFLLVVLLLPLTVSHAETRLIVSPQGPYTTINAALAAAEPGDVIEVQGGSYAETLEINISVSLIGIDQPVIDAGGEGDIVLINAPDVLFQGFTLRHSGTDMYDESAGIIITAPRVTVAENRLEEVLFGIYFANASDGIARSNYIRGYDRDEALRGDAFHVWYSNNIQLIGNEITRTRDVLINYADGILIEGNTFRDGRYGLHYMYSDNVIARNNHIENNSVGAFLMYSTNVLLEQNTFAYNRGSSGYGLALKDMDNVTVRENLMVGNMVGLYLDNSPTTVDAHNLFEGNLFAYNDEGVATLPNVERNTFTENSFIDNIQQVSIRGRLITNRNTWNLDGVGNFWSDYTGYDQAGDGIGDLIYQSNKVFERVADQHPALRLFRYSPAAQAMEFTASAFPILQPVPAVIDEHPQMQYRVPASMMGQEKSPSGLFFALSLVLISITAGLYLLTTSLPNPLPSQAGERGWKFLSILNGEGFRVRFPSSRPNTSTNQESTMIRVQNLTKQYGSATILNDISFEIRAGEAVALWGTNGAGKTTTLRCLLGVLPFDGSITVNDVNVSKNGKATRSMIGYVPQEVAFYDMSVKETLRFYARLKKVRNADFETLLRQVGLADHAGKSVKALSGGMKQRLALAIGLLSDPPILMLDEPTANLDTQVRDEFLTLIRELNKAGKTIIFSTHRIEEVEYLADRVLVLENGQITIDCASSDISQRLGVKQWLQIRVADEQRERAMHLLEDHGYPALLNTRTFYVPLNTQRKMEPLKLLAIAAIEVEDFDMTDTVKDVH